MKKQISLSIILMITFGGFYLVFGDLLEWKKVAFVVDQPVPILKTREDVQNTFASPLSCYACHGDHYKEWKQSFHAKSLQNAGFQTLYTKYIDYLKTDEFKQTLGRDAGPNELRQCLMCHAPQLQFASDDLVQRVSDAVIQGRWAEIEEFQVNCVVCHAFTPEGHWSGHFNLENKPTFYGPIKDPVSNDHLVHQSQFSPFHTQSDLCANCHSVKSFNVFCSMVYEQSQSVPEKDKKQCQDCHMKPIGEKPIAIGYEKRTVHSHLFAGGRFKQTWEEAIQLSLKTEKNIANIVNIEVTMQNKITHNIPDG